MLDGFAAPADLDVDFACEDTIARVAAFDLLARPFPLAARFARRLVMVGVLLILSLPLVVVPTRFGS